MTAHGHFHWNELRTHDIEKAKKFYADTLGWKFDKMATPDGGDYWIAKAGDVPVGGMFPLANKPEFASMQESWMSFIAVDDIDARVKKAEGAGAKLVMPIMNIPDVGRIGMLLEPGGAGIGWIQPAQKA